MSWELQSLTILSILLIFGQFVEGSTEQSDEPKNCDPLAEVYRKKLTITLPFFDDESVRKCVFDEKVLVGGWNSEVFLAAAFYHRSPDVRKRATERLVNVRCYSVQHCSEMRDVFFAHLHAVSPEAQKLWPDQRSAIQKHLARIGQYEREYLEKEERALPIEIVHRLGSNEVGSPMRGFSGVSLISNTEVGPTSPAGAFFVHMTSVELPGICVGLECHETALAVKCAGGQVVGSSDGKLAKILGAMDSKGSGARQKLTPVILVADQSGIVLRIYKNARPAQLRSLLPEIFKLVGQAKKS